MENLLEVKNISIDLKTKDNYMKLADDISFNIGKKQSFGIVGESGCGKSITALSIIQLLSYPLKVSSGQILFDSKKGMVDLLSLKIMK